MGLLCLGCGTKDPWDVAKETWNLDIGDDCEGLCPTCQPDPVGLQERDEAIALLRASYPPIPEDEPETVQIIEMDPNHWDKVQTFLERVDSAYSRRR